MMLNIENEPLQEQLLLTKVQREASADIQGLKEVALRHVWVDIVLKISIAFGNSVFKVKISA